MNMHLTLKISRHCEQKLQEGIQNPDGIGATTLKDPFTSSYSAAGTGTMHECGYVFFFKYNNMTNVQVKYEHTKQNNEIFVHDIANITTFWQNN